MLNQNEYSKGNLRISEAVFGLNSKNVAALLSSMVITVIIITGSAQAACVPTPIGMVSWWSGEGNGVDIWDGNSGTLHGAKFGTGKVGQAFNLNGVDEWVQIPHNPNLNPSGPFSVAVWIKANPVQTDPQSIIVDKSHVGSGGDCSGWALQKSGTDGHVQFFFRGSCGIPIVDTQVNVFDDQWHFLTGVFTGSRLEMYLDGELKDTGNYSGPVSGNTRDVSIGRWWGYVWGPQRYFHGLIDEVVFLDRALSALEVQAIYNAGSAGICKLHQPLHATAISPTAIRLNWDDNSSNEMGFRIQSKEGNCTSTNPWTTRADLKPDNVGDKATFLDTNLLAATPYAYQVSTYYGANNFSAYSECAFASTGIAGTPHIPTKLEAYSRSNTRVDLYWNDASNDETEFTIYRQAGSGSWTLLNTVADNSQSYSDTTATGNDTTTSYHYDVRACNASGCSVPITSSPVVPFRPGNLAATVASTVKLTWEDKSSNESGFEIQRKNGACASENPWVLAQKVVANTKAYNDKRAVPSTLYSYRVRAYYNTGGIPGGSGHSRFTGCVSVTAP